MSPLSSPPSVWDGFPGRWLRPEKPLYRIHRRDRSPWWFSHDGSGRFDLATGRGTCYLAEAPLGAFVEVFREISLLSQGMIDQRALSVLQVADAVRLADFTAARARGFGLTAAIHSSPLYDETQPWGEKAADAGFGGVRYFVSHDPSQRLVGVALFGPAGEAKMPVVSSGAIGPDLIEAASRKFGIRVLPTP